MSNSPWTDASSAFNGTGNAINGAILGLARLKYDQQNRDAQTRIAMLNAMSELALRKEQEKYYQSQSANHDAETAIATGKLDAANRLGASYRQPVMADGQGPTIANAERMKLASIMEQAMRSAALNGDVSQLMIPHNVTEGSAGYIPATGQTIMGPKKPLPDLVLGSGQTLFNRDTLQPEAFGTSELSPGGSMVMPTRNGGIPGLVMGVNNPKPDVGNGEMDTTDMARVLGSLGNVISQLGQYPSGRTNNAYMSAMDAYPTLVDKLGQRMGKDTKDTKTGRKKGDRVTTAKGTFEWTGTGWIPANN